MLVARARFSAESVIASAAGLDGLVMQRLARRLALCGIFQTTEQSRQYAAVQHRSTGALV